LKNGVLDVSTIELIPHSPKFEFSSKVNVNYDPYAWPDENLFKLFENLFGGDKRKLNLFRGVIRRAIDPCPVCKQEFGFTALRGVEKPRLSDGFDKSLRNDAWRSLQVKVQDLKEPALKGLL
jgi:hypothetical protein